MKRIAMLAMLVLLCSMTVSAQRKAVSILGDSYSTYEGFLTPETNAVWYGMQQIADQIAAYLAQHK